MMSAHVILYLLNQLGKRNKMGGLGSGKISEFSISLEKPGSW